MTFSKKLDAQGPSQSKHLSPKKKSPPLCPCGWGYNNCSTLATHLDLKHNANVTFVLSTPPKYIAKYLDRESVSPFASSLTPPKQRKK